MLRATEGYRGRWGKVMFISVVSPGLLGYESPWTLEQVLTQWLRRETCVTQLRMPPRIYLFTVSHSTDSAIVRVCVFEICVWRLTSCIFVLFLSLLGHLSLFLSLQTLHILPVMQPINSMHIGNWTPHLRDECQGTVKLALGDVFSHPSVGPLPGDSRRKFSSFFISPLSIKLRLHTRDYLLSTWLHSRQN